MRTSSLIALLLLLTACERPGPRGPIADIDWPKDAVWYQIFPERFRNGDPANDPTLADMELPAGRAWSLSPWTSDWYRLQPWERAHNTNFYESVFDRRYGGDLQGVVDKLDYLKELGITAIYFNPVFEAYSLHKYDASSYHHIDDNFGPDAEGDRKAIAAETDDPSTWVWTSADSLFLKLIREAHARGIRVVIDGVFNHSGTRFWAFQDVEKHQQASRYADWYDIRAWDDPQTPQNEFDHKGWWGYKPLPEFAESDSGFAPAVREYFFNITKRWMDPNGDGDPSDGIDGWRLDVANEVSPVFWKEWRTLVKRINPRSYIVGEIWDDASKWLSGDQFDAVMNYRFARAVVRFFIDTGSRRMTAGAFQEELADIRDDYADETNFVLQNLIDSHDTDRLVSMVRNPDRQYDDKNGPRNNPRYDTRKPSEKDRRKQKLIALFQMTYLGAPMVYYGSEAGMWGADDPDDRKPMVWPDLTYEPEAVSYDQKPYRTVDSVAFDPDMFAWYKKVIALRNALAPLRRGNLVALPGGSEDVVAYRRTLGADTILVALNRSDREAKVLLPHGGMWKDLVTESDFDLTEAVAVKPVGGVMLVKKK